MATVMRVPESRLPPWWPVDFEGDPELLDRLRGAVDQALRDRAAFYHVLIESTGRCGEVLIRISGSKGRLPLLFGREDLEPGYVTRVVKDTVARYAF